MRNTATGKAAFPRPPVAAEALESAWRRFLADRDPSARETILVQFAPLVRHVVGRMPVALVPQVDRDDLESAGAIGLLKALDRFDPTRNVKFDTFAYRWIQGSVLDHLRRLDPLSRGGRRRVERYKTIRAELRERLGRDPSDPEITEALGFSTEEMRSLHHDMVHEVEMSLDGGPRSAEDGDNSGLESRVPEVEADVLSALEKEESHRRIRSGVDALPEKERHVVSLYYFEELTLKEIGDVLGVSESRVCQLHARAVKTIARWLQSPKVAPAGCPS